MRKNVITLFVGILLLGIPMVYAGKPVKNMDLYLSSKKQIRPPPSLSA